MQERGGGCEGLGRRTEHPLQETCSPVPSSNFGLPPPTPSPQASGAGDGLIRLWGVVDAKGGKSRALSLLGGLPARGFANALAIAHSGRFVVAGMGQEPRLGRWLRDPVARNGVLLLPLELAPE